MEVLLFNTKAPFVSSRWLVMGTMDTSFVTGGVLVHAPNINVPANIQAVINCLCVHLVIG
ncbi:hypothetical protein NXW05_12210 [Phocaeicola vulgatus]|nr:hypothetical protein [Phocaeicola vulgatus]